MANYLSFGDFSTGYDSVADITEPVFDVFVGPASRLIDQITGWPDDTFVLSGAESHYVDSDGYRFLHLPKPPITVTAVEEVTTRGTATVTEAALPGSIKFRSSHDGDHGPSGLGAHSTW